MNEKKLIQSINEYVRNIHPYRTTHLDETGERFVRYLKEKTRGYSTNISEYLESALYETSSINACEIVRDRQRICQKEIEFSSVCMHHLLPFYGTIDIEYKPNKYIIGLSKLAGVCDILSNRLMIQEQLGNDILKHLYSVLEPEEMKITIRARHTCMSCRGVNKNALTITVHVIDKDEDI